MGRAKLNMELIELEKKRNVTFKKRKEGLIRKMHEFTTLCDVSACMIIYGPDGGSAEPEIWPASADEVRRVIDVYKTKSKDSGNKTFGLPDFFHDRKRRIEDEVAKLRRRNMEAKYPTWFDCMNAMSESDLRGLAVFLRGKVEELRPRIDALKRAREGFDMNTTSLSDLGHPVAPVNFYAQQQIDMHGFVPLPYPTMMMSDHQDVGQSANNSSLMMLLMNENDHFVHLGAGPSGSSSTSYKRQVSLNEAMPPGSGMMVDPIIYQSGKPSGQYYMPPAPPMLPYAMVVPQLPWDNHDEDEQSNVVRKYDHVSG